MRRHSRSDQGLNWLLLPGGPGIGSESLHELADAMCVRGSIWLVDLPGDGSNDSELADPYALWPQVLVEAADAVTDPVYVGHSTGGMYLLSTPALAGRVRGLALLDTAPDCRWLAEFGQMTVANPLPAFDLAAAKYAGLKSPENLAALAVASAEWNFTPEGLAAGRALLSRMPYRSAAVEWSDVHFDRTYEASWWPTDIPVLRLAGAQDRIVSQAGWNAPRFNTNNVIARTILGAGHFPWIENPGAVAEAFKALAETIASRVHA